MSIFDDVKHDISLKIDRDGNSISFSKKKRIRKRTFPTFLRGVDNTWRIPTRENEEEQLRLRLEELDDKLSKGEPLTREEKGNYSRWLDMLSERESTSVVPIKRMTYEEIERKEREGKKLE